ncbi:MAG: membrane protein insertion efficiency factor YidD [Spirochaetaceae bacterium]|nr:membrane protein insertion efficiency factor YidD [Spirochaetaceae bacterium]
MAGRKRCIDGHTIFANFKRLPQKAALGVIRLYQCVISPHTRPSCRFYPSCSVYAYQAITMHGLVKGTYLAARRLLRCHPFHAGGYDPVPAKGDAD